MAFTTSSVSSFQRGAQQFQGAFRDMWEVTATVDPSSIAAGAEDTGTLTVPGVALGDAVVAIAAGVDLTVDCSLQVYVSAANTVTMRISNLNASTALNLASSTWKILIGRPSW